MSPAASQRIFSYAFYIGLALVMLSLWMWFVPNWPTFIHNWRVELFASIFLLVTLIVIVIRSKNLVPALTLSRYEQHFILLPIVAFIAWSTLSTMWAPSWRSALHHSLVWSEYLIFYCIVRYLLDQPGQYKRLLYVFGGSLVLYSLPAIAGYVALSVFGGANLLGKGFARFGEQVVLILPLLIAAVARLKDRAFLGGTLVLTLLCLFMFSTFGRTNYILTAIAVIAMGVVIVALKEFRAYRWRFAAVVSALIFAVAIAAALPSLTPSVQQPAEHRFLSSTNLTASNNFRKLMMSLSSEMITEHPIIGIGADNFGFEVNKYRLEYSARNPADPDLGAAENDLPERAHNEYVQVFAELGLVGIAIFAWFLCGIAILALKLVLSGRRNSLHAYATVIGIALFLASSLVSSYSFRLIQNGFVFFFVLAVAAKLLSRHKEAAPQKFLVQSRSLKLAAGSGIVACLLFTAYNSTRVASVITSNRGNATRDMDASVSLYRTAMKLDPENPEVLRTLGMRLFGREQYSEAAEQLSRSVDMGLATSTNFSYVASAYTLAGKNDLAEAAMKQAALMYPRSVFVLVRYSSLLEQNGKVDEAANTFARASEIDPKRAKTWRSMITQGAKATSDNSLHDRDILPVMDLVPPSAIYAVQTERLIRFPEERKFSMMRLGENGNDLSPGN